MWPALLLCALALAGRGSGAEAERAARLEALREDAAAKLVELHPVVEAGAGRPLRELPPLVLTDAATLLGQVRAHHRARLQAHGVAAARAEARARREARDLIARSLAVYWPSDGSIHLVHDWVDAGIRDPYDRHPAAKRLLASGDDPATLVEGGVVCSLAQSLVVALQHQEAPHVEQLGLPGLRLGLVPVGPVRLDQETGWDLLSRGQALSVGDAACRHLGWAVQADALLWGLSTRVDPGDFAGSLSAHGLGLVEALRRRGGEEAVWNALEHPAPPRELLRAAYERELADAAWPTEEGIAAATSQVLEPGAEVLLGPLGPRHLRWDPPVEVAVGVHLRASLAEAEVAEAELVVALAELAPGSTAADFLRDAERGWKRRRTGHAADAEVYWLGKRLAAGAWGRPQVRTRTSEASGGVQVLTARIPLSPTLDPGVGDSTWLEIILAHGQRLALVGLPSWGEPDEDEVIAALAELLMAP